MTVGVAKRSKWRKTTASETDIDVSAAVYTGFILLLTIANPSTGKWIDDCRLALDLAKASTGFAAGYTSETLTVAAARAVDGTNYRINAGVESPAAISGTNAATRSLEIPIGPIGPGASVKVYVKVSTEQTDVQFPYTVYYKGPTPTLTEVDSG